MKTLQRMLTASAVVLFGFVLYACGGGSSVADATLTQSQFDKMLNKSSIYTSLVQTINQQKTTISDLQGRLSKVALIGHPVGGAMNTSSMRRTYAATNAVSFGPCTDMGVFQGRTGGSNAMFGAIQSYQTCTGYEYTVSANDGTVQAIDVIEYDGVDCTGNAYADTGRINLQLALNGAVFKLPNQIGTFKVTAGETPTAFLLESFYSESAGGCSNTSSPASEEAYAITANDTSITGVPNTALLTPFSNGSP